MVAYRPARSFPWEDSPRLRAFWKAVADRRKPFDGDTSCSTNGEGVAAAVVISLDEE
jgi:hypothetical protein